MERFIYKSALEMLKQGRIQQRVINCHFLNLFIKKDYLGYY